MIKEFLLAGIGSFFGGGMRYLVSKGLTAIAPIAFPFGTFTVNILGCLLIGFLSAQPANGSWLTPQLRLVLTTGFCGGFTTFSTFMNESSSLIKDGNTPYLALYLVGSLAVGLLAVAAGNWIARAN